MTASENPPPAGEAGLEVTPASQPPAPLVDGEYITDHAIETAEDDRFGHQDIVAQLAELCLRGPGKTNIALFAPWGTGKSGIAKLLEAALSKHARFAYFDAFKHRQTPLRRSFLRAVARGVGRDPGASDRIFKEETSRHLDKRDRTKLLVLVAQSLAVGLLLMAVVALGLALLRHPPKGQNYWDMFVNVFTGLGGVAAVVAAMIGVLLTVARPGIRHRRRNRSRCLFMQRARGAGSGATRAHDHSRARGRHGGPRPEDRTDHDP